MKILKPVSGRTLGMRFQKECVAWLRSNGYTVADSAETAFWKIHQDFFDHTFDGIAFKGNEVIAYQAKCNPKAISRMTRINLVSYKLPKGWLKYLFYRDAAGNIAFEIHRDQK